MRVQIDRSKCQTYGVCAFESPAVFRVEEGGELEILQTDIDEAHRSEVEAAVFNCPTSALSISPGAPEAQPGDEPGGESQERADRPNNRKA